MYKLPDFGRFPKLKDARHSYYQYIGLVLFGALALWSNMGLRHPLFADASLSVLVAALVFFTVPISHFKSCHREKPAVGALLLRQRHSKHQLHAG